MMTLGLPTVDTAEITQIYLQRPAKQAGLSLALWFCRAHGIEQTSGLPLINCASAMETKLSIVGLGLNRLSLEPLREFNKKFGSLA